MEDRSHIFVFSDDAEIAAQKAIAMPIQPIADYRVCFCRPHCTASNAATRASRWVADSSMKCVLPMVAATDAVTISRLKCATDVFRLGLYIDPGTGSWSMIDDTADFDGSRHRMLGYRGNARLSGLVATRDLFQRGNDTGFAWQADCGSRPAR
jgi:hypothetical protein